MFKPSVSALAVALICGGIAAGAPPLNEVLPAGPMQEKAGTACLSCHEARIIVQQRLSKATWTREVDKMTKWGAEVDPQDRDALIDYFSAHFGPDQPPYAAPTTVSKFASKARSKAKR